MDPPPERIRRARARWEYRGQVRPEFAQPVETAQESVWDYPRPPRIAPDVRRVSVRSGEIVVAESVAALRVLETASPPTFYLPPADVRRDLLVESPGASVCEWKGRATYWSLALPEGRVVPKVAWSYGAPFEGFEPIADYVAFYPARVECFVAGVRVGPQPGGFYGGWVTPEVVGPFKGEPGSEGW